MNTLLHIRLLGDFRLRYGQTLITSIDSPRLQSLLTFLVLQRDAPQSRQQVAYLLWPDSSEGQARANLRGLLLRLRRALPAADAFIQADAMQLQWQPAAPFCLDVDDFERYLAEAETAQNGTPAAALQKAVAIYHGDLLPACYDDWIIPFRERLREAFVSCLLRLANMAERNHEYTAAYEHYLHLSRLNPLSEKEVRGQMRALAAMGRLPEAIAVFNELQQLLESELEAPPASRTQRLAAQLKEEMALKTAVPRQNLLRHPPFVGRVQERALLVSHLDQAGKGEGRLVVVLGEAGAGKTRLLAELAQAATWRGWQIAWGRAEQFTLPAAYAPLVTALTEALPRPRVQQLAHLIPSIRLTTLAPLIPAIRDLLTAGTPAGEQLANTHTPLLAPAPPRKPANSQLAPSIGAVWQGLQSIAPQLFLLDDVQWSDPALWPLLDELRERLARSAVLLVLSGRPEELRSQPVAWSWLCEWDQAGAPIISLAGLEADELDDLVKASGLEKLDPAERRWLQTTGGGNPLFTLSMLERGERAASAENPTLAGQILHRLAALSQAANDALQGAAVIGYRFDYAIWEAVVADSEPARLPVLAGELETSGLIRLEAAGYCFAHDTVRAAVYTHTPVARRQWLHQKALAALVNASPADDFALLHHAEQAGDEPAISRYALRAGQRALDAFTYQAAVSHFSRALALLPPDDWQNRYTAVLGQVRALDILAEREAQQSALKQLQGLATHLENDHQADAAYYLARYHWTMGDYPAARQAAESGLALAQPATGEGVTYGAAADCERRAGLLHMIAQVERNRGQYARAQERAEQARDLYRLAGSRYGDAALTDFIGGLAWEMNQYHQAAVHHAAAAEMFRDIGDLVREAMALNNLGTAYWGLGDYGRARTTHERALAVNRSLGHRRGEADNLDNLGGVSWVLGDYPIAIDRYQQALAIRRQIGDDWGISISLGNLGSAYRLQGDLDTALSFYNQALPLARRINRRLGQGYILHGRGLALLEAGRLAEAGEALHEALAIRTGLGEQSDRLETLGGLALLALAQSELDLARRTSEEMLDLLATLNQAGPALRQWVHYVAYRVRQASGDDTAAVHHLLEARAAMMVIATSLTKAERRRFLTQVPLNRQVETAVSARKQSLTVSLVRGDVPPGRTLTPRDYTEVTWTVYTPEDDLHPDPVTRRRHVIKRLLAEAEAQDAAPTADDLAAALGVSRRTIRRDMKVLALAGVVLSRR
jgi:DNA-binding SARP family transcriptional activator